MNREQAKYILPILQAFSEGKTIQFLKPDSDEWRDVLRNENNEINFEDLARYEVCYRVKPEPKYRPFANAQECLEEMKKHVPFGWLKNKDSSYPIEIISTNFSKRWIKCCGTWFTPEEMFKDATFLDGTPFGIRENF